MTLIQLQPFIGTRYRSGKARLLIVGESHYGVPDEDISRSTTTVVENWKSHEWSIRYLVAIGRTLTGLKAWELDREEVLEDIAWYNFVQVGMETLRHRPTYAQLTGSVDAFVEVISQLDPTHIIVTGKLAWRHIPPFRDGTKAVTLDGKEFDIGAYATPFGQALALNIAHPSRGFSPPVWQGVVRDFLMLEP